MNKILGAVLAAVIIALPGFKAINSTKNQVPSGMSFCGACGSDHGSNDRDRDREQR